ncbi:MAG: hypothetical protein J0M20_08650 [Burkholderiales bacterium]|nr:hypothetical protein [Burkholderiales bacterium]
MLSLWRRHTWSALILMSLLSSGAAWAAKPVVYVAEHGSGNSEALWLEVRSNGKAALVLPEGRSSGVVSTVGSFQVVTLDTPVSEEIEGPPDRCNGDPTQVRRDLLQVGVRLRSGTGNRGLSAISRTGTETILTGCDAGLVSHWGDFSGTAGVNTVHRSYAAMPPTTDLVAGAQLAGMSGADGSVVGFGLPADVATVGAGVLTFEQSGAVPYTVTPDGWFLLSLPGGQQRAYLRLTGAVMHGVENWMAADVVSGVLTAVSPALMIKPVAGTAWGSGNANARMWESSLFTLSNTPFFVHLYRDGTGERISRDLIAGTESRAPISAWYLSGGALVTERMTGSYVRRRLWQPLAANGKAMGVMESETVHAPDGTSFVAIAPRINAYVDLGKAVKPPVQVRRTVAQGLASSSRSRSSLSR